MNQLELLKKAVELAEQNPGCEIIIASDTEGYNEEYAWTKQKIRKVELSEYYETEDGIYLSPDEVVEHFEIFDETEITEEEAEKMMKTVILIKTGV